MSILDMSRGELSPIMRYRSDLDVYHRGASSISNFLPTPQGGMTRRYGSQIIGELPTTAANPAIETFNLGSIGLSTDIPAPGSDITVTINLGVYDTENRIEDIPKDKEIQILLTFSEPNVISAYWLNTTNGVPVYMQQLWDYDSGYVRPTLGFDDTRDIRVCQIENSVYIVALAKVYELYWDTSKVNDVSLLWNNTSNYVAGDVVYHVYSGDAYWLECITAHASSGTSPEDADGDVFWKVVYPPYLTYKDVTLRVGEKLLTGSVYEDDFDPLTWNENTDWVIGNTYKKGDVVLDTGTYYECVTAHTAGATFAGDAAYWNAMNALSGSLGEVDTIYRRRAYAGREETIPREIKSHQGRLLVAASARFPASIFGSEIGKYAKFGAGTYDDDPWIYTVAGDRIGKILWMYVTDRLYLGTKGGIYAVSGLITPSQFLLRKVNSHAASEIEGVTAAGNLLYFQSDKQTLREVTYVDQQESAYQANDITLFATHLFQSSKAVKMVVQHSPHTIIWILRADGKLVALSYEKTVNMMAFSRHYIEDVTILDISGGTGDDLYAIAEYEDGFKLMRFGAKLFIDGSNEIDTLYLDGLKRFVLTDLLSDFAVYIQNDDFRAELIIQSITSIDLVRAKTGSLNVATKTIAGLASQCAFKHFVALTGIDFSNNSLSTWASIIIPSTWITIDFSDNSFTTADVNQILIDLAASEVLNPRGGTPSIDLSTTAGTTLATLTGLTAGAALVTAGWTVTLDNAGSWWDGYTLTFDANSGTGTPPTPMSPFAGATITIPGDGTLAKTGYIFGGWNTLANGTGTGYAEDDSYVMPGVDTTLYAVWIAVYTLTFNGNGHTGGTVTTPTDYQKDVQVTIPYASATSLVKTGYEFDSWNSSSDGTGNEYTEGQTINMPSSALTLYAIWTVATYDITYVLNGGVNGANPTTYTIETPTITLIVATKTGYTFDGWFLADEVTEVTQIAVGSYGDVTLYAHWTAIDYTLTYDKGTATGGDAPAAVTDANYLQGITLPLESAATMYKTGYSLEYWVDAALATYVPGATYSMPAANTILTAQWALNNTYYVIFNTNGGSGSMSNQGIVQGVSANLTANTFTRTGYTFSGWNTVAGGGGTAYANQASYTMGSSNANLYAQWTVNSYTVSFDSQGGSSVSNQSVNYGALVSEPSDPTKTNYNFSAWYTDSGLTTLWTFASDTMGTANMTLYAKWVSIKVSSISTSIQSGGVGSTLYATLSSTYSRQGVVLVDSILPTDALNRTIAWYIDYGSAYATLSGASQSSVTITAKYNSGGTTSQNVYVRCYAVGITSVFTRTKFVIEGAS